MVLAIEAASENDVRMLPECKKFDVLGLKVEAPKESPNVVVFGVNNEMTSEELVREVYVKNLKNAGVS